MTSRHVFQRTVNTFYVQIFSNKLWNSTGQVTIQFQNKDLFNSILWQIVIKKNNDKIWINFSTEDDQNDDEEEEEEGNPMNTSNGELYSNFFLHILHKL